MTLNLSQTSAAIASRKWTLENPEAAALAKLRYLQDPKNKERMHMLQKVWIEQNKEYYKEYMRLSNKIAVARRKGDAVAEHELKIQRKLHRMSLPNRKTLGRIVD